MALTSVVENSWKRHFLQQAQGKIPQKGFYIVRESVESNPSASDSVQTISVSPITQQVDMARETVENEMDSNTIRKRKRKHTKPKTYSSTHPSLVNTKSQL